jgi:hypothetical protein
MQEMKIDSKKGKHTLQHLLLFLMIAVYAVPIFFITTQYNNHPSVSHIIKTPDENNPILVSMIAMGILALLYEWNRPVLSTRYRIASFATVAALLIGIYGLVIFPESTQPHYVYAAVAFFAILSFMFLHYWEIGSRTLCTILGIQLVLFLSTILLLFQPGWGFATGGIASTSLTQESLRKAECSLDVRFWSKTQESLRKTECKRSLDVRFWSKTQESWKEAAFFYAEVLFILNFAAFYLWLHYKENIG